MLISSLLWYPLIFSWCRILEKDSPKWTISCSTWWSKGQALSDSWTFSPFASSWVLWHSRGNNFHWCWGGSTSIFIVFAFLFTNNTIQLPTLAVSKSSMFLYFMQLVKFSQGLLSCKFSFVTLLECWNLINIYITSLPLANLLFWCMGKRERMRQKKGYAVYNI